MPDKPSPDQIPPGFKLRHTLRGHEAIITQIAWSPNGQMIASGSFDATTQLWNTETGELHRMLVGQTGTVYGVAWSPDGWKLATGLANRTIRLWDVWIKEPYLKLTGHSDFVRCVGWPPAGGNLASGSDDKTIRLWGDYAEQCLVLSGHDGPVLSVAWSPDGQKLASGSTDETLRFWDGESGHILLVIEEKHGFITSLAWSPDGRIVASANNDGTISIRNAITGKLIVTLEGHIECVTSVSFSFDGCLLASKSRDNTIRLWRCDIWESVAVLDETSSKGLPPKLSFHPTAPVLATLGEEDTVIRIWDLDFDVLLGAPPVARGVSYTNAKVVLVGDSGVGKTGLGVRLAEGEWRPTPGSTHGMNVWPLHSETEREVMLWDFAGQDEYRLVHQLFLNETNVALMLYDPTKSQDTFEGVDYWEKALSNAVPGDVRKIIVAARVDVGGVRLTDDVIAAHCDAHGYLAHHATSAETGEGCDELRAAIMAAIPWDKLPRTSSPEIFKRIKDFLAAVRQGNRVLVREPDLRAEFDSQAGADAPTGAEFRTVIGHVETAGLIKRLSFGDFVLLKPELLNGYASDIVDAARRHPDGLGAVRKSDVLDGRIKLKDEGGLNPADKIFLLHATVEVFLRLGLALEQDGNLVFPSKFNRQMPPLEENPVVEVEFAFEGPVENLYTTLVVKLYYGGVFTLKQLWKSAAEFVNGRKQICGFQLQNEGEGQGKLKVFYAEGVKDDDKALFLKIVADHFKEKRVEVSRERIYRCQRVGCRELVRDRNAVRRATDQGIREMPCLYCFKPIRLFDALEMLYGDDKKFLAQIAEMENRAEASMERGGELVSAAAELRTENFKTWAGDADIATVAIVFTDVVGSTKLNVEHGDEHWRQAREAHFARARELVTRGRGYLIKTIGDSVMAAFHSADAALDFALAFHRQTGHESVRIRAGIHIGPVEVTAGDAFGQQVSMAARVEAKAKKDNGVWVSAKVKEDIDILRAAKHKQLKWTERPDEELSGFPKCTLWSVE